MPRRMNASGTPRHGEGLSAPSVGAAVPLEQSKPPELSEAPAVMSAADRENPQKISGEALRELAHRRGMARSEVEIMSDERIRVQMRYIVARQYEVA